MADALRTRFVHPVGWVGSCMLWWGERGACAPNIGHTIRHELRRGDGEPPEDAHDGWNLWYPEPGTPCDDCGEPWPGVNAIDDHLVNHSGSTGRTWDTPSGDLEPGCLWWNTYLPHDGEICSFYRWTNCDGRHLMARLPIGHSWDVDGRASNCDQPDETTHRCWVRHGNPETEPVTVGKGGHTCGAGGGSILSGDYHGFLTDGEFRPG